MVGMLTDTEIRALKPRERMYKVRADRGLYLHVMPNGSKLWRFRYVDQSGTDHTLSFGDYPRVTLSDARRRAQTAQDERRNGNDPATLNAVQKLTLEAVTLEWWEKQRPRWRSRHADDMLRQLNADLFPQIGRLHVPDVAPRDILKVVQAIEPRSVDLARRMRQRLEAIFGYAIANGYTNDNPAVHVVKAMSPQPPGNRRPAILDIDEARAMLRQVELSAGFPIPKLANRFLALTAVRPGEMRFMKWSEVQGDVWELSGQRMKMGRPHRVPLSEPAIALLDAMKPLSGHTEWVFPTSKGAVRPIGDNSIGVMLNRAGYRDKHCPHGWRSTFSTYWNDRGGIIGGNAVKDIVEHALAHAPDDRVAAAYNRGTLFDARRELMTMWANVLLDGAVPLDEILTGSRH